MLNCGGLNLLTIFYYLLYCQTQTRLELVLFIYKTLIDLFCAVLTGYTRTLQQRALQHLIETPAQNNYGFLMDFVEDNRSEDENMVETFLRDNISCGLIFIVLAIFGVVQPNARQLLCRFCSMYVELWWTNLLEYILLFILL
jgi:hypothetical protein